MTRTPARSSLCRRVLIALLVLASLPWVAAAHASPAGPSPASPSPPPPGIPPSLLALAQTSSRLSLHTVILRETARATFGVHALPPDTTVYHVRFDRRQALAIEGHGRARTELRLLGGRAYFRFGAGLGPWVWLAEAVAHHTGQWQELGASDALDATQLRADYLDTFLAPLVARHIPITTTDSGPATVDGRATERFTLTFTIPIPRPPGTRPKAGSPTAMDATLQAYVAPNGLLVRESLALQAGLFLASDQVDVIGVDVPMRIRRPVHSRPARLLALGHGIDLIVPPGVRVPPALVRHSR